jgi:hypothetical protein
VIKMSLLVLRYTSTKLPMPGVAADLSRCYTPTQVADFTGKDELLGNLSGTELGRRHW